MAYVVETHPSNERVLRREARLLTADDPATGRQCFLCDMTFVEGDSTNPILLGCGHDATQRCKAAAGQTYNAQWLLVHSACADGV